MTGVQKLDIAARRSLPFGALRLELMRTACGAHSWALRTDPGVDMGSTPRVLTNGFCDDAASRRKLALQLRALADAVEAWP